MDNINLEQGDLNFRSELTQQPGGKIFSPCLMCCTCTAISPITKINDKFNPFGIIRLALFGLRKEIFTGDFIWLCSNCYACQERYPQGVNIPDLCLFSKTLLSKRDMRQPEQKHR